ncbi:MAG: heme lyase CcmF/NrfE family subunit [Betaproteobacteria bacterium]|nr:heme lyase CcmF/NrfE family subunit [Betaproteobacteria bacterium]
MVPELGNFALMLTLCIALAQAVLPLIGAARGNTAWMALARPAAQGQFLFIAFAFACLTYAFVTNDFSVKYVAEHSNTRLPLEYRVAGVWGGHEGSLLLWTLMLGVWMFAVSIFSRTLPEEMVARVLGIMGLVSVGFLVFMLFASNPFDRLLPAAADGRDLNPLLQDPGMVFHPPMLYMGYVGFSVAFAFSMAALIDGRLDATWARWSRPWTTVAWMFLTLGIALGSYWAYYELGWGGWWFWDPVENASFMPWLVGTALIHSLAVTEKRGAFRIWTVFLAILAFALSLLGTFLVRSGVLTSVHAFATDPKRGIFILVFLAVVVGSSLTLFAWRASKVGLGGRFAPVSRESMLLTNNALLLVAVGAVLLGTLYPLVLDALGLGKISVGPPYFETVFVPLMAPALFLMGVGPLARWKQASVPELAVRLRWALAVSFAAAIVVPLAMGGWSTMAGFGMLLAAWIVATSLISLKAQLAHVPKGRIGARLAQLPSSYYGMFIAHLGIAVFVVGVTLVKGYEVETDVRMEVGDSSHLAGYAFRLVAIDDVKGPNYLATRGTIEITRDGGPVTTLKPEKRLYTVQNMPMTEASIDYGVTRHLYVALGEPINPKVWIVRLYYKPFISWIWVGCLMMGFGGLLAAIDRRYRVSARAGSAQTATTAGLKASPAR